ncbi:MAG: hypothetical protein PF518_10860 [Spirochaetaceae bacterium]|nr:hypothetical protein [Spirochaetaceae bacterium]
MNRKYISEQDGFTYIEVIVALFIISFSAFILWGGLSGALKASEKIFIRAKRNNELTQLEYQFRTIVNFWDVDYWDKSIDLIELEIYQKENLLFLKFSEEVFTYRYLQFVSFNFSDKFVELIISDDSGIETTLHASYGSFVLDGDM